MALRLWLLSCFALCLTLAAGCRGSDAPDDGPFALATFPLDASAGAASFTPTLEGPLRLLSATPAAGGAPAPTTTPVTVTFSQPMVALGDAAPPPASLLTIEPAAIGRLRWAGSQTLVWEPTAPLQPATRYTVRVAAGLTSVPGDTLQTSYTWSFETPRPTLTASVPGPGEPYADPQEPVRLIFNLPVEADAAAPYVAIAQEDDQAIRVGVTQTDSVTLLLTPRTALRQGTLYRVTIREGLPTPVGPLGSATDASFTFSTYAPLQFTGVSQPRGYDGRSDDRLDPGRSVTLAFSTPVRFGALRAALRFEPAIDVPAGLEARDGVVSATHAFDLPLRPTTRYTAVVDSLTDVFGQRLDRGRVVFRTGPYRPAAQLPRGLYVVEADESATLPMGVTNVPAVRIGMERLTADAIIPRLPAYDPGHYYGEPYEAARVAAAVNPTRRWALDLPENQRATVPVQLDSLLTDSTGIVALTIEAPLGESRRQTARALAQVTRLGLTAKFGPHQNLAFVTDLATAQPIAGARVTLRDATNRVRWDGTSDADGVARLPGWAGLGIEPPDAWRAPVQYLFVEHEGDLAFTSSLYDDGLEPYRFEVPFAWRPEAVTFEGSVFSDRGLYRTGETVHVKAILRRHTDGDWQPVTDSVRVLLIDPLEEQRFERMLHPNRLGTIAFDWSVPPSAPQGAYTVRIAAADDTAAVNRAVWQMGDLARGTFRVDAFRRATFDVTAQSARPAYVAGDFFEGTVSGRYLFGTPMRGQEAQLRLTRAPRGYDPPGYPGYRFGSFGDGRGVLYTTLAERDSTLGDDGTVSLRTPLPGNAFGAPTALTWSAAVRDPARREGYDEAQITLHPGLYYIGLKPARTFLDLSTEESMSVDLITVDPNGAPIGDADVQVELVRQQWNSVREIGPDGRLRWRSERIEEPVGAQALTTEAGRLHRLTLPVDAGGSYILRATGSDVRGNTVRTEALFYASGGGYTAWRRTDDDRIDLVADHDRYAPGDVARVMVASPFEEAQALITVEREGILSSRVQTLTGTSPQIEIPITEAHLPNVFVSVILLHGRSASPTGAIDAGPPAFKIGYVNLPVDAQGRHLRVEMETDRDTYAPGDDMTVRLRLRSAAGTAVAGEIALSVADAGVLDLIGYTLPDPFDAFYGTRPLRVTTSESRANLVRQRNYGQKEEDLGGGGGRDAPTLRTDFRPSAYWNPTIPTDSQGRAEVTVRLPQSLTTFRLMATALSGRNEFGRAIDAVVVTQPLVLQPALPRFARVGDRFEAGVLVTNRTGQAGTATVSAQAEGLRLAGVPSRTVALEPNETKEVRFAWYAAAADTAALRFAAQLNDARDAFAETLVVQLPTTKVTDGTYAATTASVTEALQLPADRVPGAGGLDVRLASTALVGLDGAARYLFTYPYGCLEQRTSSIRPLLIAGPLLDRFDLDVLDGSHAEVVAAWMEELRAFWTGQGFSLWRGGRIVHPYVSAYVALALADAEDAGFVPPAALAADVADALEERVRRRSERPGYLSAAAWNDTQALMLYALSRHGRVLAPELDALAQRALSGPNALSPTGLSHLLRALVAADLPALARARTATADRLRSRIRDEGTTAYLAAPTDDTFRWIFASDVQATAHGLTALLEHSGPTDDLQLLGQRMTAYLIQSRRGGHWASTHDNAAVVEAFQAYADAFEQEAPNFTAVVTLAGRLLLEDSFRGRSLGLSTATVAADRLPDTTALPLSIQQAGDGRLYYSLYLETYTSAPVDAASSGLRVSREVQRLDDAGEPTGPTARGGGELQLDSGELVRVTLRVATPADRHYVAVDDPLPAGLEPLNFAFETTNQRLEAATQDPSEPWWGSFTHTEIQNDRVLLFADYLTRGEHTYTYVARATTPGTFVHPPVRAELMYEPTISGRTASGVLTVQALEEPAS